jgi:hypothetical protein
MFFFCIHYSCLYHTKDTLHLLPLFHNLTHLDVKFLTPKITDEVLLDILRKTLKLEILTIPWVVYFTLWTSVYIWHILRITKNIISVNWLVKWFLLRWLTTWMVKIWCWTQWLTVSNILSINYAFYILMEMNMKSNSLCLS